MEVKSNGNTLEWVLDKPFKGLGVTYELYLVSNETLPFVDDDTISELKHVEWNLPEALHFLFVHVL